MRLDELTFRPASTGDAPRLTELVIEGFESYRAFAPPDWTVPPLEEETARVAATLAQPSAWCEMACDEAGLAGHAGWLAAMHSRSPAADPGMAHFWQLFVRRDWWGSGLASRLHSSALGAARARGFEVMRLYTPAAHGRARRFYEREGWALWGTFDEQALGMPIVEYRRVL